MDERIGRSLFDPTIRLPAFVLRETALAHDIALLAAFCESHGVSFAPHGKTTMAPAIFRRQAEAGAWAITVATPWQAEVAVDAGIERMAQRLAGRRRRLPVLVDVGVAGARTGVRTDEEAEAVARAIDAADALTLAGVSLYEGVVSGVTAAEREAAVRELTDRTRRVVGLLGELFDRAGIDEIVVTGGGSTYPDVVAEELTTAWDTSLPVRVVLRSGAYVTHDHGLYERSSPFGMRAKPGAPRLEPAIEVWAPVLSVPEPGLAFAGAGRRDLPVDQDLPVVIKVRAADTGPVRIAEPGFTVTKLADQHAFLALSDGAHVAVGDSIAFGISHPCTAFQLWREALVVDDADRILDVYELSF